MKIENHGWRGRHAWLPLPLSRSMFNVLRTIFSRDNIIIKHSMVHYVRFGETCFMNDELMVTFILKLPLHSMGNPATLVLLPPFSSSLPVLCIRGYCKSHAQKLSLKWCFAPACQFRIATTLMSSSAARTCRICH